MHSSQSKETSKCLVEGQEGNEIAHGREIFTRARPWRIPRYVNSCSPYTQHAVVLVSDFCGPFARTRHHSQIPVAPSRPRRCQMRAKRHRCFLFRSIRAIKPPPCVCGDMRRARRPRPIGINASRKIKERRHPWVLLCHLDMFLITVSRSCLGGS
ncbi:hypothetical protein FJTKL_00662 [Diaporthe vaccinii]|uniref:Uncharacterized protein n=1 Tax=Diaporthe vaccinii TaxID=105482 RepID=A0ABR4F657_9PEZI